MQLLPSTKVFLRDAYATGQYQWAPHPCQSPLKLTIKERLQSLAYALFLTLNLAFADIRAVWVECWKQPLGGRKFLRIKPKETAPVHETSSLKIQEVSTQTDRFQDIAASSDDEASVVHGAEGSALGRKESFDETSVPELNVPAERELWQRFSSAYFAHLEEIKSRGRGYPWKVPLSESKWNLAADISATLLAHRSCIRSNRICPRNYTSCLVYPSQVTQTELALACRKTAVALYNQMWAVKSLKEAFDAIKSTLYN